MFRVQGCCTTFGRHRTMRASLETAAPRPTVRVLAIDDDESVRRMITDYLSDNEVSVTALPSGREIADAMSRETIDLLILDLKLPGEDGMEIARRLREA